MADEQKVSIAHLRQAVLAVEKLQLDVKRLTQVVGGIGARLEKLEAERSEQ